ncbi:ABC transporter [Amycolatopsis marina]|uniref:ABC transporter n=1 Tax=Amycolatopsis marina TaxID=490629 RepID=A0A1I1BQE4_9PSEU|nr:ATP-binding cassette domain-containing protein [Amycolatopsis marina]SFB52684.1 ABC transporter [Amycolatopsis marina]
MQVHADRVSVDGPHGTLLPSTSFTVSSGEFALVHGDPGTGLTAFGLALAGRLRPTTGRITLDGSPDAAALRRQVAVVDAPGVSEPEEALALRVVVGEELALAGRQADRESVLRWLAEHDVAAYADTRFENVAPATRTRLLCALAASRRDVRMLVLDRPDRHTSDVDNWSMLAQEHAERGLAVVVLTATVPHSALPCPSARIGAHEQPPPQRCTPEGTDAAEPVVEEETVEPQETTEGEKL